MPCIRHGAGLLFCSDAIQPHTSVYSVFCRVDAIIPPTPQNSIHGFTAAFPAIAPVQPPAITARHKRLLYHLRHGGAHTSARTRSTDTRYHRHAGTLGRSVQPPIIIRYIRGRSIPQTVPAAAGQRLHLHRVSPAGYQYLPRPAAGGLAPGQRSGRAVWHSPPGGAVQQQGRGGRRGTTGGSRRISFRAFSR